MVFQGIRLSSVADSRVHLPPYDAPLVQRRPALVQWAVDSLARHRPRDRDIDRPVASRKPPKRLGVITSMGLALLRGVHSK